MARNMGYYLFCCVALLSLFGHKGDAARILAIFPFPGRSHFISFSPLLDELAKRGHEMTVISAFPRKTPLTNYKDATIEDYFNKGGAPMVNLFESHSMSVMFLFFVRSLSTELCGHFLNEPEVQKIIQSPDDYFDLIIYEPFMTECAYGIVNKFTAPFIHISSHTITKWMGDGVGNPYIFSYMPSLWFDYSSQMSFTERIINVLAETIFELDRSWRALPKMEAIMRKHFPGAKLPSIREIENNSSFLLLNSHPVFSYPRPYTPNTQEVGGMHLKEPKKLPQDLQKLLDDATDGVVYFSLGSNIRSVDMPETMRSDILKSFSKLKQMVLWKWETGTLPGQPKNVHVSKWFPQSDILAHPNVRAFITHGGLLSIQEATFNGIPLIVIPFWGDQKHNARNAVEQGFAVRLDIQNMTEKSLDWSLNEVLNDKRYRENAKYVSSVFKDQMQSPLERAVFWTEYVIRHNGAPHLRSAGIKLNFVQYFLLDVIAVCLLVSGLVLAVSLTVIRMLYRRVCLKSRATKQETSQKKTN